MYAEMQTYRVKNIQVNVEKTAACAIKLDTTSEFHESRVRIWNEVTNEASSELNCS
jgi:hypothetical protein